MNFIPDTVFCHNEEAALEQLVVDIFEMSDGARRLQEFHERLGSFLALEARKALKL